MKWSRSKQQPVTGSAVGRCRLFPRGGTPGPQTSRSERPSSVLTQTRRSLHCEWLAGSHCPGALERVLESRFPDFSLAVVPVPCFLVVICFRVSFRHRRGQAVAAWRRPRARLLVSPVVTLQSCRPRAACFPFLLKLLKSGFYTRCHHFQMLHQFKNKPLCQPIGDSGITLRKQCFLMFFPEYEQSPS